MRLSLFLTCTLPLFTACSGPSGTDAGDGATPDAVADVAIDSPRSDALDSTPPTDTPIDEAPPVDVADDVASPTDASDAPEDASIVMPGGYGSTWIAFASKRFVEYEIFLVRRDGTGLRRVTDDPLIDIFPAWSSDGHLLAFASNRGGSFAIYIEDLTDGSLRSIDTHTLARATIPAFSPDGMTIAFEGKLDSGTAPDIFTIPTAGGTPTRLTNAGANDSGPVYSPDGATIYFVSNRSSMFDVWAMDADGSNQRAITTNAGVLGRAAVSPDGGSIAYARLVSGDTSGIVVRNLTNGMERVITMQNDSEPSWNHDGTQLAITSLRSGNPEIYVIDATSGAVLTTPAPDPALDGTPVFSPAP